MKAKKLILAALAAVVFAALALTHVVADAYGYRAYAETVSATAETDDALADSYQLGTGIVNAPTVIADVKDGESLASLTSGDKKPSNAIIRFSELAEAVGYDGSSFGNFKDVYKSLNNKILPIIYLESEIEAEEFIYFTANVLKICDAAIASPVPAAVKKVKTAFPHFRGVIDFTNTDWSKIKNIDIVQTLNLNYATVALLPQKAATRERVTYIQARFKTAWVKAESTESVSTVGCVASGAYGIVTDDFSAVQSCLAATTDKTYSRPIFNVAHRGLPNSYNENSLSGTKAAIECGATHVELDGKITTDGVILMMHDDEVSTTATGSGNIENMTFAEARTHLLDLYEPKDETIPTLDEIMKEMKGTGVILVFEIKTSKPAIIAPLRAAIEENNFWDQIVVIAFDTAQLAKMKEQIPEVPTANLNSPPSGTALSGGFLDYASSMGELNTGIDCSSRSKDLNEKYLKDRGIIGWYWTMNDRSAITNAIGDGYVGVTNNSADSIGDVLKQVDANAADFTFDGEYNVGDEITLTATTYGGTETTVTGVISYAHDFGDRKEIVASYTADGVTYLTDTVYIYPQNSNTTAIIVGCVLGGAALCAVVAVTTYFIVRKKLLKK